MPRSRAKDPQQEQLRERKDQWNKEVSKLIAALIALKKGVNGQPIDDIGLPPSRITEPLPPQIGQIGNGLGTRFTQMFSDLDRIISEQDSYSSQFVQQREQKNQDRLREMQGRDDITTASLTAHASNKLTRILTYLRSPFQFGDKDRAARISMLRGAAKMYDNISDVGDAILKRNKTSIPEAFYDALNIYLAADKEFFDKVEALYESKKAKKEKVEELVGGEKEEPRPKTEPEPEPAAPVVPVDSDKDGLITNNEVKVGQLKNLLNQQLGRIERLQLSFSKVQNSNEEAANFNSYMGSLQSTISDMIATLDAGGGNVNELTKTYKKIDGNLSAFEQRISSVASIEDEMMRKVAGNMVGRWFRRKLLNIFQSDDSELRLLLEKDVQIIKKDLNEVMNVLESSSADINTVRKLAGDVALSLATMAASLQRLAGIHNSISRVKHLTEKSKGRTTKLLDIKDSDIKRLSVMSRKYYSIGDKMKKDDDG